MKPSARSLPAAVLILFFTQLTGCFEAEFNHDPKRSALNDEIPLAPTPIPAVLPPAGESPHPCDWVGSAFWSQISTLNPASIQGQQLILPLPLQSSCGNDELECTTGLRSSVLNLANKTIRFGIDQVDVAGPSGWSGVAIYFNAQRSQFIRYFHQDGRIHIEIRNTGNQATMSSSYDATQHRYLRLVHDDASSTLKFQYSPDGVDWSRTSYTGSTVLDFSQAWIEVVGQTTAPLGSPGMAVFTDFFVHDSGASCPLPN